MTLRSHRINEIANVLEANRYRMARAATNPDADAIEGGRVLWMNVAQECVDVLDGIDATVAAVREGDK